MTGESEQAGVVVAAALGIVLRLDPEQLAASTRLADLGADSLVLVSMADVVEADVRSHGWPPVALDDATLARAVTVGDLAASLAQAMTASPASVGPPVAA